MSRSPAGRLDTAFAALGDPTRRSIVTRLARGEATVTELARPFGLTQPTISKHLKVLEQAGLIESARDGPRRPRRLNPAAMKELADWLEPFAALWSVRFDNLDRHLARNEEKDH